MDQFVYALYHDADEKGRKYFYVGISKDVGARLKQHHYSKLRGHEDKYAHIRQLESQGIEWNVETLKTIPDGSHPPDNERWYVIHFIREGHDLMNMKHGNKATLKTIARQAQDLTIRSVADVTRERLAEQAGRSERSFTRKKRLQRNVLRSTLLRHGIPNVAQDKVLTARLRSRCIKAGFSSIPSMHLPELVSILRMQSKMNDLMQLLNYRQ